MSLRTRAKKLLKKRILRSRGGGSTGSGSVCWKNERENKAAKNAEEEMLRKKISSDT